MQPLKEKAWVGEQELSHEYSYSAEKIKSITDFKEFGSELINKLYIDTGQLSDFIINNKPSFEQLKVFAEQEIENSYRLIDDQMLMLITLGCAKAICEQSTIETWQAVTDIKYSSWEVENWLSFALEMSLYKENNFNKIISLAENILTGLCDRSLEPKSERFKGVIQNQIDTWSREKEPLKEIWFGLRGSQDHFLPYLEYAPVFKIWFSTSPISFFNKLKNINPYIAQSLLALADVASLNATFANWVRAIELTPVSFNSQGTYKNEIESYLLPILLSAAYQEVIQAKLKTKDECYVIKLVENIVDILAIREDFLGIVMRWGNWLERVTLQDEHDTSDFSASSFVAGKLLHFLGSKVKAKGLEFIKVPAADFERWEFWAHQAVMADHLHNGFLQEYKLDCFINDWQLDIYSWQSKKAKNLLQKAFDYTHYRGSFPGKIAYQLAYPLTKTNSPDELWLGMWKNTHALREIVQFGHKTDVYGSSYKERNKAGDLLLVLFLIGLALLDLLVTHNPIRNIRAIKKLFSDLYSSLVFMIYIDNTINKEKWQSLFRHLAIRRYIWECDTDDVFDQSDTPAVSDFIELYKNDAFELARLVENILINTQHKNKLKCYLKDCGMELEVLIDNVKTLVEVDSGRYSLEISEVELLVVF